MTQVSLRLNLVANTLGQMYSAMLGILMLPVFYSENVLGAESVGLIGFYTMLMFWFNLLDMGITPTLSRETTRFLTASSSRDHFYSLLMPVLVFFVLVSLLAGLLLFFNARFVVEHWLQDSSLAKDDLVAAVQCMAIALALRWNNGLMRGIITGAERLLWLNLVNSLAVTLRFVLVIPIMMLFGFNILVFFVVQVLAAVVEYVLMLAKSRQLVWSGMTDWTFSWQPLQQTLRFSLSVALLSLLGVAMTQLDKLALSSMLALRDYGDVTVAATLASGLLMVGVMFSGAILPRLTATYCQHDLAGHFRLYRNMTQWLTVLAGSTALVIIFAAKPLLFSWIGEAELSQLMLDLLPWYCLGSFLMLLNGQVYYLQYARGELKLHLRAQLIMVLVWILALYLTLSQAGAQAAAIAWCVIQLLLFLVYTPLVHRCYQPGLHQSWLWRDIVVILLPALLLNVLLQHLQPELRSRVLNFGYVVLLWCLTIVVASVSSSDLRSRLRYRFGI